MRILRPTLVAVFCCVAAQATDREFQDIVHAISEEFHTKPTHIPFFGLVNAVTFVARPAGTRHIDLAVFEDLDSNRRAGRDLPKAIREAVGNGWKPFVQVFSKRKGSEETTFLFMRVQGKNTKLLITAVERDQATVVQLLLDSEALERWMANPGSMAGRHEW
jgi:hypothetical protein